MAERLLRVGIAGIGFGAAVHAPALMALPGVEVAAIAASSRHRAEEAAARLGIAAACEGIGELLAQDLDAVTLALPPLANEEAVDAALAREVAILSEKPLAHTPERAAEFAQRAGARTTALDFEFPELASFAAAKALIDSGALGAVRTVRLDWRTLSAAQKFRSWSWKTDARAGGGVLTLLGTHALYLLEWLFGPLERIGGTCDARRTAEFAPPGAVAAEDTVELDFAFRGGGAGSGFISNAAPGEPVHRWTIEFADGSAVIENTGTDYMAGSSAPSARTRAPATAGCRPSAASPNASFRHAATANPAPPISRPARACRRSSPSCAAKAVTPLWPRSAS
jgi:predicted dehydrogenase